MNGISFSTFLFLTVQLWNSSEASCLFREKVQILCDADFAVVAKVNGKMMKNEFDSDIKYTVEIKEVFEGGNGVSLKTKFLFGLAPVISISVLLDVGKTYLVTGHMSQGKPKFNSCEWVQTWSTVSEEDKLLLQNYNASDCDA